MTEHEMRIELHRILAAHDDAIAAIREAHIAMEQVWQAHDDAVRGALEANRAALRLLDWLMEKATE